MNETEYLPDIDAIMDYDGIRYMVLEKCVVANDRIAIQLPQVVRVHGMNGYMYIHCIGNYYLLDLRRWQLLKLERGFDIIHNTLVHHDPKLLEVFQ